MELAAALPVSPAPPLLVALGEALRAALLAALLLAVPLPLRQCVPLALAEPLMRMLPDPCAVKEAESEALRVFVPRRLAVMEPVRVAGAALAVCARVSSAVGVSLPRRGLEEARALRDEVQEGAPLARCAAVEEESGDSDAQPLLRGVSVRKREAVGSALAGALAEAVRETLPLLVELAGAEVLQVAEADIDALPLTVPPLVAEAQGEVLRERGELREGEGGGVAVAEGRLLWVTPLRVGPPPLPLGTALVNAVALPLGHREAAPLTVGVEIPLRETLGEAESLRERRSLPLIAALPLRVAKALGIGEVVLMGEREAQALGVLLVHRDGVPLPQMVPLAVAEAAPLVLPLAVAAALGAPLPLPLVVPQRLPSTPLAEPHKEARGERESLLCALLLPNMLPLPQGVGVVDGELLASGEREALGVAHGVAVELRDIGLLRLMGALALMDGEPVGEREGCGEVEPLALRWREEEADEQPLADALRKPDPLIEREPLAEALGEGEAEVESLPSAEALGKAEMVVVRLLNAVAVSEGEPVVEALQRTEAPEDGELVTVALRRTVAVGAETVIDFDRSSLGAAFADTVALYENGTQRNSEVLHIV